VERLPAAEISTAICPHERIMTHEDPNTSSVKGTEQSRSPASPARAARERDEMLEIMADIAHFKDEKERRSHMTLQ